MFFVVVVIAGAVIAASVLSDYMRQSKLEVKIAELYRDILRASVDAASTRSA